MTTSSPTILLLLLILPVFLSTPKSGASFTCKGSTRTCPAMLGFKVPSTTTYFSLASLFQPRSLTQLLAANNLPANTSGSFAVPAGTTVRVPFPCSCSNGTGVSHGVPVYTVKKGEYLNLIAGDIYGHFVTYQDIADANGIKDVDAIYPDQRLVIPLPCSCDEVDGEEVLHYGYKVEGGDTFQSIAAEFESKAETLMRINGMGDGDSLKEEQILDVPLKSGFLFSMCSSSISKNSSDSPLLVPSGQYALTAGDCIQCSCSSSSWRLQSTPTRGSRNSSCSSLRATCTASKLSLGGSSPGSSACEATTCEYGGYFNGSIMTVLTNTSTCPAAGGPTALPAPGGPRNAASTLLGFRRVDFFLLCSIAFFWYNAPVEW